MEQEVASNIKKDNESWKLKGDPMLLAQVLSNLIDNSIRATAIGVILVTLSYDAKDEQLRVQVQDSGSGISDELIASLSLRNVDDSKAIEEKIHLYVRQN